jgi:hypothetical protein
MLKGNFFFLLLSQAALSLRNPAVAAVSHVSVVLKDMKQDIPCESGQDPRTSTSIAVRHLVNFHPTCYNP